MPSIKNKFFILFFFAGLLFLATPGKAQIHDEIIKSLKEGNSRALSDHFNQNIELVVPGNDNVYSKAQAEQITGSFFNSNKPENFSVIHQGGKDGAQYVIGNLDTRNGRFRVYFLLKQSDDKSFIHQLRIEKEE